MKRIKQFRYYSSTSSNNYPSLSNYYGILSAGNLFASHGGISQLGIQALPGTKFYLNNSPHSITIGSTGIYELNMQNMGHIYSIRFDPTTLSWYEGANSVARILIDIVYEGGI